MAIFKKSLVTLFGSLLIMLGLIFIIIPGPSLLFIVPGLLILSYEYPLAKRWLRHTMKLMQKTARWVDQRISDRKYYR